MTAIPPGWYPDPAPASPPGSQRWWDGTAWSPHGHAPARFGPTTPDGVPLAGWWWRVLAAFMDSIVVGIVGFAATFPVQLDVQRELRLEQARFQEAVERGQPGALGDYWNAMNAVYADHLIGIVLVPGLIAIVYYVGFLRSRGATPGKLMCGMRVRLRESEGRLSWSTISTRFGVQFALPWGVIAATYATSSLWAGVIAGGAVFLFTIVDALWATGARRQTLHDLAAGTVVVKPR